MINNSTLIDNYPDCLIIDRPDLKSRAKLFGEGILTILFWGFWFYLWLPFVSLLAWWMGFQFFYFQMLELGGINGFIDQMHVFTSGISLFSFSIAAWSFYNLRRYGSKKRRSGSPQTDTEQLARTFKISIKMIAKLQKAKHILFSFRENNAIDEVGVLLAIDGINGQLISYKESGSITLNLGVVSWLCEEEH